VYENIYFSIPFPSIHILCCCLIRVLIFYRSSWPRNGTEEIENALYEMGHAQPLLNQRYPKRSPSAELYADYTVDCAFIHLIFPAAPHGLKCFLESTLAEVKSPLRHPCLYPAIWMWVTMYMLTKIPAQATASAIPRTITIGIALLEQMHSMCPANLSSAVICSPSDVRLQRPPTRLANRMCRSIRQVILPCNRPPFCQPLQFKTMHSLKAHLLYPPRNPQWPTSPLPKA